MAWSGRNCWKHCPSIDNSIRKQIWEENYKTRENLKEVQQSEHFWSFQMTCAGCCCLSPSFIKKRYGSLQTLDEIECCRHCESHCKVHRSRAGPLEVYHRDVGTETYFPSADKSVGPEKRHQISSPDYTSVVASKCHNRTKPPNWERNECNNNRQFRQQTLQKIRKDEEALQQTMQRNKKAIGNFGNWGTEYTRSYKDRPWPKNLSFGQRPNYESRCATPMPHPVGTRDTPLPRHAGG